MKIANFLWSNPYQYGTEDYQKYDSLRSYRNRSILFAFVNFSSCFRDYGIHPLEYIPVWFNYVFIIATVCTSAMAFMYTYMMRKIGIDKKNLQLIEDVLEE